MEPLAWTERDGGLFLDLAEGGDGAGTFLAVRPHEEPEFWRPIAVLSPGAEERELGDGVMGREHAADTIVKFAIQALAREHGFPASPREWDPDDTWPKRTQARLWQLLAAGPHSA